MGTPWVIRPSRFHRPVSHWSYTYLVGGFNPTPLKNHGVKVSWDDDIPKIWKSKKCSKPNHQPVTNQYIYILYYIIYIHIRQLHLIIRISKYTNWYFRLPLGRFLQHTYIIMYIYIYIQSPSCFFFVHIRILSTGCLFWWLKWLKSSQSPVA